MQKDSPYQNPELCAGLLRRLERTLDGKTLRFMEVCGTHTVALFQSGLRSLLPKEIKHLSGPGCPVCVTHESEVAAFLELAKKDAVCIATFGDLIRVPGPEGASLKHAQAQGANIRIIYSPLDALRIAEKEPELQVILLGVGFETTAPAMAATVLAARERKLKNFKLFSMHKLVPPVLRTLLEDSDCKLDAFLLPGHVATVSGLEPFEFLVSDYQIPAAVGGFEPAELLLALCELAEQHQTGIPRLRNCYTRAVNAQGNPRARALLAQVFQAKDALWRGIGQIPASGLQLRQEFVDFDATEYFALNIKEAAPLPGCRCGSVLKGQNLPPDCALFGKKCTPATPLGPCMVSSEGSCAAYYKYAEADA